MRGLTVFETRSGWVLCMSACIMSFFKVAPGGRFHGVLTKKRICFKCIHKLCIE